MVQLKASVDRKDYPQDQIFVVAASKSYEGAVTTPVDQPSNKHIRLVDSAVQVQSVLPSIRKAALSFWENSQKTIQGEQSERKSARKWGIAVTVIGALAAIGTGIARANSLISHEETFMLLAGSLGTTVAGIISIAKQNNALGKLTNDLYETRAHKAAWADPIDKVITQRRETNCLGFSYVFTNQLKSKTIHPVEVNQLWIDALATLIHTEQKNLSAFKNDILGWDKVNYAWENGYIQNLQINGELINAPALNGIANRYQACYNEYQKFDAKMLAETTALSSETVEARKKLEAQRERWMLPAQQTYQDGLLQAKYLYNLAIGDYQRELAESIRDVERACSYTMSDSPSQEEIAYQAQLNIIREKICMGIRREYNSNSIVKEIERRYLQDCAQCEFLFNQTKEMVDNFFKARLDQLNHNENSARETIGNQRARGEAEFVNVLNQIMVTRDPFAFQAIEIPNPQVHREWALSNFEKPSWNDVYGNVPRYKRSFTEKLSRAAWDLFWSTQGFGKYSYSTNWSQRSYDRTCFPLQNQGWFSLDGACQRPSSGLFRKIVVIPAAPERRTPASRPTHNTGSGGGFRDRSNAPERNNAPTTTGRGTNPNSHTVGFGGTTKREETRSSTPPANGLGTNPSSRTAVGFGGTDRR